MKMRKLIISGFIVGINLCSIIYGSGPLFGEIKVSLSGGYNTVEMIKFNEDLLFEIEALKLEGWQSVSGTATEVSDGINISCRMSLGAGEAKALRRLLLVGFVDYLKPFNASLKVTAKGIESYIEDDGTITTFTDPNAIAKIKIDCSFSYLTFGIGPSYEYQSPKKATARVNLLLGYALAGVKNKIKYYHYIHREEGTETADIAIVAPAAGSGISIIFSGEFTYNLTDNILLSASTGYRWANISKMKYTKNIDVDKDGKIDEGDIRKGEVIKDQHEKTLPFNFSGLFVNVGVGIKF